MIQRSVTVHTIKVHLLLQQHKTLDFLYPLHDYSPLNAKRQIKRISPTVFHEIRTANVDTNTDKSNLDSTEMFSEANIKMLAFLADNIFGKCLVDVYFNRQTAYIQVQTVILLSSICSFIRKRQISCKGFSRKMEKT